ncbi:MAG TPA: tripartite tricarboxylate transporter substrate-binding protein [Burkholderiales bacterium]
MLRRIVFLAAACTLSAIAFAQPYPAKPLHLVVPFPPGGGTDLVARNISRDLAAALGQPVIVENRPGGGGLVAWTETAKAVADGYTMVMIANNLRLYPLMGSKLNFDPDRDLVPVAAIASVPMVLVGSHKAPAGDLRALLAAARSAPGTINYATPGYGSPHHLATALFATETHVALTHVPYKGTAPVLNDLLADQVEIAFLGLSAAIPHIKSGKLRPYGVAALKRSAIAPDMPTIGENGGPVFDASYWYAIAVPAGTPGAVVERLSAEVLKVLARPATQEAFLKQGFEPMPAGAAEAAKLLADEVTKWKRPILEAKVRVE